MATTPNTTVEVEVPTKPQILISGKRTYEITSEVLPKLEQANGHNPHIFLRAGKLCRLISYRDEHNMERPRIEPFSVPSLRGVLDREADWYDLKNGREVLTDPPRAVVDDILSLGEWPFPGISGIVEMPVIRGDGTILSKPGYDRQTGLYYWAAAGFTPPAIPDVPTREQVQAARALLEEVIYDFPFVDGASRANTLGLLLTPAVRPAIRGCVPLAGVDAPQHGSGKGLIADVVGATTTGKPAAKMTAPRDEGEWRRTITSTLRSGATLICFDNVEDTLDSPALAAALTAEVWEDRVLGTSENVVVPQRAVWMATGNHLEVGRDLQRRIYPIRIDPKTPQPWLRKDFRHPKLLAWITENRPRLVAAILTIARAWYAAGCPPGPVKLGGGFDEWSEIVGGILYFAGIEGFLGNLDWLYKSADRDSQEWIRFLTALQERYGAGDFTTAELKQALENDREGTLRDALPKELATMWASRNKDGAGDLGMKLAHALSRQVGRRYGDLHHRLEQADEKRHNATVWYVASNRPTAG